MDALKCHPDMSPITQHWVVNEVVPVVNWDGARHTCANWDHVVDWAKKNRIVPAGKASIPEGEQNGPLCFWGRTVENIY